MKANILLEGPTGTGKTFAVRTLLPHFRRVVVLSHEQGFWNSIKSKPIDDQLLKRLHHKFLPPAKLSWATLKDNAQKISLLNNKQLQDTPGINKHMYQQFIEMISLMADFVDENGVKLGPIDELDEDCCFVDDGLTGLSRMSIDLACGAKPIKTQPDWGVGMDNLHNWLHMLTTGLKCSYVQISHIERETNEVSGGTIITVSTLGRKLAPKIPQMYDEVVLARKIGSTFTWSTSDPQVDLKSRILPLSDNMAADFGLIFKETYTTSVAEVAKA